MISTGVERPATSVYGRPLAVVMKVMRVIATAGRHMAAMLVCRSHHCQRFMFTVAQEIEDNFQFLTSLKPL